MRPVFWPALLAALALIGCAAKVVLLSKSALVPQGLDLSGQWALSDASGETRTAARETLVFVFFESGKNLKVTQTGGGLFVSFDRSVVEEYRFGERREISVGEITADRVSGWEGRSYVIETLDKNGAQLSEKYALAQAGRILTREIVIHQGERTLLQLRQAFEKT